MKYSEDRIKNIALQIHDRLYLDNDVDYTDEDEALKVIKDTLLHYFQLEDQLDDIVTKKILSLKRGVTPGSAEWDIMYQKYFEEEMQKMLGTKVAIKHGKKRGIVQIDYYSLEDLERIYNLLKR